MSKGKRGRTYAKAKKQLGGNEGGEQLLEQLEQPAAEVDRLEDIQKFLKTEGGQSVVESLRAGVSMSIISLLQANDDDDLVPYVERLRASLNVLKQFEVLEEEKQMHEAIVDDLIEQSVMEDIGYRHSGNYAQMPPM